MRNLPPIVTRVLLTIIAIYLIGIATGITYALLALT